MIGSWSGQEIGDWRKHRFYSASIERYTVITGFCLSTYGGQSSTQRVDYLSQSVAHFVICAVIYLLAFWGVRLAGTQTVSVIGEWVGRLTKGNTPVQLTVVSRGRYRIQRRGLQSSRLISKR